AAGARLHAFEQSVGASNYTLGFSPWRSGWVARDPLGACHKRISRRRRSAAYWLSGGGMGCGVSRIALRSDGVNGGHPIAAKMNLQLPVRKPAKVQRPYPLA